MVLYCVALVSSVILAEHEESYNGGHLCSVAGMRNLRDEQWARRVGNITTEPHDHSADVEHGVSGGIRVLLGQGLDKSTSNDQTAADCSTHLASQTIGNIWGKRQREHAAQSDDCAVEAKPGAGGFVEDCELQVSGFCLCGGAMARQEPGKRTCLPGVHGLEAIE